MTPNTSNSELTHPLSKGLIISVGEARKILGKKSTELSDDEVESLIVNLQFNAEVSLL